MVSDNNMYAIETISLTKVFPDWWGRSKVVAVDNLDLQIKHNEVYGLLGPNGSGKTTTLKILLSLLHPTKGAALILGGSSRDGKISSKVGYLPEESYLYKFLTAYETLDFYGRIFGLHASVRHKRIETLLEMVGLAAMANRAVGTYSLKHIFNASEPYIQKNQADFFSSTFTISSVNCVMGVLSIFCDLFCSQVSICGFNL